MMQMARCGGNPFKLKLPSSTRYGSIDGLHYSMHKLEFQIGKDRSQNLNNENFSIFL